MIFWHSYYCILLQIDYLITMCLVQSGYVDRNKPTLIFVIADKPTEAIYFIKFQKEAKKHPRGHH